MKVIRNHILPFGRYGAMNLFGVLFVREGMQLTQELINHESIHTRQMRELLFVPFYVLYVSEWLLRLVQCGGRAHAAYLRISFEQEAYSHGSDLAYLQRRRHFAQWRRRMVV